MLATFSLKMVGLDCKPPSFLLGLCYFSNWLPSWPSLGAIWARFGRGWGSILEVFDSHFSILFVICLNHFYILQRRFSTLLENSQLFLENSWKTHGSSWKTYFRCMLGMVLDGLVGSRGALRISMFRYRKTAVQHFQTIFNPILTTSLCFRCCSMFTFLLFVQNKILFYGWSMFHPDVAPR